MRVCIVTHDLVGPIKNGGIGTYCYYLGRLLADNGISTDILFTGPVELEHQQQWVDDYKKFDINLHFLPQDLEQQVSIIPFQSVSRSMEIDQYLRKTNFDIIHFQGLAADGFIPLQAKSAGLAYGNTIMTEMLHATHAWVMDGMKEWPSDILRFLCTDYSEKYSFSRADYGLSPTRHMFEWAKERHWPFPNNYRVISLPFIPESSLDDNNSRTPYDTSHMVFFGRLETRKGLELFLEAMGILGQKSPHVVKKISLVGKEGVVTTSNKSVLDLVSEFRASYPSIELILKKDLGHQEAIQYVQATGGILVMPSLLDNSPFTAIEAMVYKMPFLAAKTGGIPEIVGNDAVLFEPNPLALVEKVISIEQIPFESMEYAYSHSKSNNECIDFHHELMEKPKSSKSVFPKHSKVSICIPHRNMTVYLSELLVSIGETTYPNYEVICIDDGSDIPREKSEFQRLKSQYAGSRWTFKTIEHGGAPKARNTAASIASGEFLIFVDSDNIIMPEMATTMVRAMHVSEADCLTCYFRAFSSFNGYDTEKPLYQFAPIGPCQELSYLYNVIGDTNFIIKKQVFDSMGGFPEDSMRWEDWEFLAHLMLAGYKLDVIPEPLLQYRHTEEGVSQRKQTNYYDDYRRILRPWEERFPGYICNSLFSMIAEENKRALIASQENSQIYSFKWFFSALSDLTYDYLHNSRFKFTIPIFRIPSRVVRKLIGLQ